MFGTDGIRGAYGKGPITEKAFQQYGSALVRAIQAQGVESPPQVLVVRDTRQSGIGLSEAFLAGVADAGGHALNAAVLPTAAAALLVVERGADAAAVISASHNPAGDNGLKLFNGQGQKIDSDFKAQFLSAFAEPCVQKGGPGKIWDISQTARNQYLGFLLEQCKGLEGRLPWRVGVDAAHGAGAGLARELMWRLGVEVVALGDSPTGFNINEGCGATDLSALQQAVKDYGLDWGFALDGDADRLMMVDCYGRVLDGDHLLYLMTQEALASGLRTSGVVGTVMTNQGYEQAYQNLGMDFVRTPVGDQHIAEALRLRGWHLGGESSGHLLDNRRLPTGDGLLALTAVLRLLDKTGTLLEDWVHQCPAWPSKQIKMPRDVVGMEALQPDALADLHYRAVLAWPGLRVVVRPSGTEPVVRLLVEGPDDNTIADCLTWLQSDLMASQLTLS